MCTCVCSKLLSRVQLFATPWIVVHQALLSMGLSRQEHWSGLPCPPSGNLPYQEMEPMSLMSPALAGGLFTTSSTWEAPQGAHIKPNCPKALSHQRASRGTRQTLPQTFSKGAGPFSYCVLFFPGCTGCKILFSALVCLSHQIQALASLSLTQEDFWGWE